MDTNKPEDLRVRKTKEAIRNAFKNMICEMDYGQMTIKKLAYRAQINRKTFCLHYQSLDDVLAELQDEIADNFIRRNVSYANMQGIKNLILLFFESASNLPLLHEHLLCNGSYQKFYMPSLLVRNRNIHHLRLPQGKPGFYFPQQVHSFHPI